MSVPLRFDQLAPDRQSQIQKNLSVLHSKGASDDEIESYLRDDEHLAPVESAAPTPVAAPPAGPSVRPDASSALARNRPNPTGDLQAATANPGKQGRYVSNVVASHLLNTLQGVPGMEAAEAGIGAAVTPMDYSQSLGALRNRIQRDVGPAASLEKIAGTAPLGLIKASPAILGAGLGAADRLLQADPDAGIGKRVGEGAVGAVVGGTIGKLSDMATQGVRALATKNPAKQLVQLQADRAASAKQLYGAAIAEGNQNGATSAVRSFLAEPDIAPIVSEISASRQGATIAPDSPEMVDLVYKELSDQAGNLKKALGTVNPRSTNSRQFQAREVGKAQQAAIKAMNTPGVSGQAMMPSYEKAVQDYADRSAEIEALKRGYGALRNQMAPTLTAPNSLGRTDDVGFSEWAKTASPGELLRASQGIRGGVSDAAGLPGKTFGPLRRAASASGGLLRSLPSQSEETIALLQRLGLTSLNAATSANP